MEYPAEILPKQNFKHITCNLNEFTLGRFTSQLREFILEEETKTLKDEFIINKSEEVLDYSTSLLGVFKLDYFKIKITDLGRERLVVYCEPSDTCDPPPNGDEFEINDNRHFFLIIYSDIVNIKAEDGIISYIAHTPMKCNYWHFSVRWQKNGIDINPLTIDNPKELKRVARQIRHDFVTHIKKHFSIDNRDFPIINEECYLIA